MTQRSICKRIISITMGLAFLALLFSLFFSVNALSAEYIELTGRGNSMYPTIANGDSVRVQLCVNGTLINVGDIIAYSTIATGTNQGYMWISHRVTEKYRKGDTWYFKTKGDNNPKPDPWEVPEYWLLGIVVGIDHTEHSYARAEMSAQTELPPTTISKPLFLEGWQTLLFMMGTIGLSTMTAVLSSLRRRQKNVLMKANVYSCYSCRHYEIQYTHRLESINGRIGLRKIPDFSGGFCKHFNFSIVDFPRRNCKQYKPKTYT